MKTRMNFKDEFYQKLKLLVLPIAIQNFMLALVSATDAIMLGWIDQTSLSAVSLAGQVQFVLSLFISGIAAGAGIMAAQYWGKQDAASIEKVIPIALRTNLLFSGLFTILAGFCPEMLMRIFTNDAALVASGSQYLRAVALSYVLCGISQVYLILLKNTGHAAVSSRISSTAVVLNIILNAILIYGLCGAPALGIRGAAYATVAARVVELIWAYLETKKPERVRILWNRLLFRRENTFRRLLALHASRACGLPRLGNCLRSVLRYHGTYGKRCRCGKLHHLDCQEPPLLPDPRCERWCRGSDRKSARREAREYGRRLSHLSIAIGIVTGGLLMLISPAIVHFAPLSDTAAEYLQYMLLFCGLNLMAQSVNTTVLDGIFCAGGDAKFDMQGNIGAMWCFSVPLGFLAAFWLKLPVMVVYCIVNLDEIVKLPAVYHHYKKYIWVRNITRDVED